MSEKRKYLLILGTSVHDGLKSGQISREIQIECEPENLKRKIEEEKCSYDKKMQSIATKVNSKHNDSEDASGALVTTYVKQVLPL